MVEVLQGILHVWRMACQSQKEAVLAPCESHHCSTSDDGSVEVKVILMQTRTQIYTGTSIAKRSKHFILALLLRNYN